MSPMTDTLTITVIEPEELAPVGRLGEWLFAEGASLRMVRPWRGEPIPSLDEIGDGLVVLGGSMSAHDEGEHPWLADLRELLRGVVADDVPAIAICLGAQVAAEALGGSTAVPALGNDEVGVVELTITAAGESDPVFGAVAAEAIRAAHRAGISTSDGTRLPVIVSHHDAVTQLPEAAILLASSDRSPVHTWRAGRLLAFQHHPESDPARVAYWRTRDALNDLAGSMDAASLQAARDALEVAAGRSAAPGAAGTHGATAADLPEAAASAGAAAREQAERVDPAIQAFGRSLARVLVRHVRARRLARCPGCRPGRLGLSGCASFTAGPGSVVLGEVLGVDDGVGVALLGQEALPVGGVLLVGGVAGDDRVEVGLAAVLLGAHDPSEPLGLLLA